MYLPYELDPQDTTQYAVVRIVRSTGAREILATTPLREAAETAAGDVGGYVIELRIAADFR